MNTIQKQLCLSTILTLVMASGAVAIGFTSFVQAEIKGDIENMNNQELINREKINSIQITQAEMYGKMDLILQHLQAKP